MKRKIIDSNGRLFGKISFIDVVVLLAVIAVVLTVLLKPEVIVSTTGATDTTPVSYTIVARDIRRNIAETFLPGDTLFTEGGVAIGKITDVKNEQAKLITQLVDGTYIEAVVESKVDAYITVLADCSHSNGRYYANRTFELFVNQNGKYLTKYVAFPATVMEINPVA